MYAGFPPVLGRLGERSKATTPPLQSLDETQQPVLDTQYVGVWRPSLNREETRKYRLR